jgi:sodium/hydrogen exchanger-like protein 6/7/sodium/hydrogen exchanger 8
VAALTLINPAQYPKLFSIIFGEGMVNDAVAIILFKVVGKPASTQVTSWWTSPNRQLSPTLAKSPGKSRGSFC